MYTKLYMKNDETDISSKDENKNMKCIDVLPFCLHIQLEIV